MAQFDYGTINPLQVGGSELASDLNSWRDAVHTQHAGTARPAYAKQYMMWWDTAAAPSQARLKIFLGGNQDVVLATLNLGNGDLTIGGTVAFNGLAISQTPPANPVAQPMWWQPGIGRLAIWNGSTWVDAMETPALVSAAATPAPNFPTGVAVDTTYAAPNGITYRWNGQRWIGVAPAAVRSSGDTMSGALNIVATPATLLLRDKNALAGSRAEMTHGGDSQTRFDMFSAATVAAALLMDFNVRPGNLSSDVNIRYFRDTNTSGRKKLVFFPGDGSGTPLGGIELSKTDGQIKPYGPWNFTEKMITAGNFQTPFQVGRRRIWQNNSSGQLLYKDGSDPLNDADGSYLVPLASLTPPVIRNTPGNFNLSVPIGISAAYVTLIAGGGGGGGCASSGSAKGGGGGGGGYVEAVITGLTPGQSIACTCGGGGNGGTGAVNGAKGGNSSFGPYAGATGGAGGAGVSSGLGSGGTGGGYSVGLGVQEVFHQGGFDGSTAWNSSGGWGGFAGGYFATNGDQGEGNSGGGDGYPATKAGCGGGGAANNGSGSTRTGGVGGPGLVIVTWI